MNECTIDGCDSTRYTEKDGLCRPHYRKMRKYGDPEYVKPEPAPLPECTIHDCGKSARSGGAIYCKMHYHRWYRHGSADKVSTGSNITAALDGKYQMVAAHGHPLANASGRAYTHRVVLYAELGGDDSSCHYCRKPLEWSTDKTRPNFLQVDHVNNDKSDNRPENLVPCCATCNTSKALTLRHEALMAAGYWSSNDTIAALKQSRMQRRGFDMSKVVALTT